MRKILILLFCLLLPGILPAKIKTMSYWLKPTMSVDQAKELARFDMVVVDIENVYNNLESVLEVTKRNPTVVLICYSNPMEVFDPQVTNRPLQSAWTNDLNANFQPWLLKTGTSAKAVFYKGMRMLNMSSSCPKVGGRIYAEWMADLLIERALKVKNPETGKPLFIGYFMDNCTPTASWMSPSDQFDLSGDGYPETAAEVDYAWSKGNRIFLQRIRDAMGPAFILIGNKGVTDYADLLQGRMFEWFPNDYLGSKLDAGWWQSMANASQTGPYTIFLLNPKDVDFGLRSAQLLDNVYVGVGNSSTRWYPQFDEDLGSPGERIILRKFSKKNIIVTPAERKGALIEQ